MHIRYTFSARWQTSIVCASFDPPGLFPLGLVAGTLLSWPVVPCPRPLVGLNGLGLSVGVCLVVGAGGCLVVAGLSGLTAGFEGMDLVPAPVSTVAS